MTLKLQQRAPCSKSAWVFGFKVTWYCRQARLHVTKMDLRASIMLGDQIPQRPKSSACIAQSESCFYLGTLRFHDIYRTHDVLSLDVTRLQSTIGHN